MTPRIVDPDRTAEVESQVIEAARDLLAEGGLGSLSMRQVAERVGVSATALYHYFENKDDLVRQVVGRAFVRFGAYLKRAAATHPRGSLDRVRALGEAYLQFATENEAYFKVLFSIQRDDPRALEDLPEGGGWDLLRQAVEDAIASGAMRPVDPGLAALYLWSVTHGIMTIALACRIDECSQSSAPGIPTEPLDLFRAFQPLVRDGIRAPAEPTLAAERDGEAA